MKVREHVLAITGTEVKRKVLKSTTHVKNLVQNDSRCAQYREENQCSFRENKRREGKAINMQKLNKNVSLQKWYK